MNYGVQTTMNTHTHTHTQNQKQITHGNNNSACLKLHEKAYRSVKSIKTSLLTLSEINLLWVLDKQNSQFSFTIVQTSLVTYVGNKISN